MSKHLDTMSVEAGNTGMNGTSLLRFKTQCEPIHKIDFHPDIIELERGFFLKPRKWVRRTSSFTPMVRMAPNVPVDLIPANGEWILGGDYTFEVDQAYDAGGGDKTGVTAANGWRN